MTQTTDTWARISSIPDLETKVLDDIAVARATAHAALDVQFDRTLREQMLLLEQLRRDVEGAAQH